MSIIVSMSRHFCVLMVNIVLIQRISNQSVIGYFAETFVVLSVKEHKNPCYCYDFGIDVITFSMILTRITDSCFS